jgi:hypothetical protein
MENRTWQQLFADEQTAAALIAYQNELQTYQEIVQQAQAQGIQPHAVTPPQPPVKLPVVRDFYDHAVHIAAHNRFRKTDDYDRLPPELQAIIDQHVAEHERWLAAKKQQAAAQPAVQGVV